MSWPWWAVEKHSQIVAQLGGSRHLDTLLPIFCTRPGPISSRDRSGNRQEPSTSPGFGCWVLDQERAGDGLGEGPRCLGPSVNLGVQPVPRFGGADGALAIRLNIEPAEGFSRGLALLGIEEDTLANALYRRAVA